jgi:hypothetical protein
VEWDWWIYAGVGGLGAFALEAGEIALYIQKRGHAPWKSRDVKRKTDSFGRPLARLPMFVLAVALKVFSGLVLVGALAADQQVASPLTAVLLGAAATNVLRRAAEQSSVPDVASAAADVVIPPPVEPKVIALDAAPSSESSRP